MDEKRLTQYADLKELRDTRQEVLLELGEAKGRELGLSQGERRKAEEIARRMLASGLPLEQIADFTGLSQDDLRLLQSLTPA